MLCFFNMLALLAMIIISCNYLWILFSHLYLLQAKLVGVGIFVAGTIRKSRFQKWNPNVNYKILVETSCVLLIREYIGLIKNFEQCVQEYEHEFKNKKKYEYVMVKCSTTILLYNVSIGKVDKNDFLIIVHPNYFTLAVFNF